MTNYQTRVLQLVSEGYIIVDSGISGGIIPWNESVPYCNKHSKNNVARYMRKHGMIKTPDYGVFMLPRHVLVTGASLSGNRYGKPKSVEYTILKG
jgi:hypothetical protein